MPIADLETHAVTDLDAYTLGIRFGTALLIGLLVGLEREWAKAGDKALFAGIRTFPSIALMGATAAMVSDHQASSWFLAAAFFGLAVFASSSHFISSSTTGHGTTTEITSLLVFMLGALAFWGHLALVTAIAIVVTLVLSLKDPLHQLAHKLEAADIFATLKFGIVAIIVLPLLPDVSLKFEHFEFLEVLNPRRIWMLVVFVSGIAFLGYISSKTIGPRRGIPITGLLGGIVSSTSVAMSMAQRSHEDERLAPQFSLAVALAWTVRFPRTIVEVCFLNWSLGVALLVPIFAAGIFGVIASGYLWFAGVSADADAVKLKNPFRLVPAFRFGALFAVFLVLTQIAFLKLGERGIFIAAVIGGLVDTRPISLSIAHQAGMGQISELNAVMAVMISLISNTMLNGIVAIMAGAPRFRRLLIPAFLLLLVGGIAATFAVYELGPQVLLTTDGQPKVPVAPVTVPAGK